MNFKVRKIQNQQIKIKNKLWRKFVRVFGQKLSVAIVVIVFFSGIFWIGSVILDSDFFIVEKTRDLFSFGPLKKDKNDHTNVLLLGVAGEGSEGGNLSDSIMIASINPKNPSVSFLSLPRDLFISSSIGERKINEIYAATRFTQGEKKGLEVIKNAVSEFTGVKIHYGAVVNFQVFEEIIDALGGVDLFVPETIEDPFYPDSNYGYQTFVVRKGFQHFDGATALKYTRSRKTSSDYDRAHRQQDIILAIRKKAESMSLLSDFDKLGNFFEIYRNNVNTDIGLTEMIALAKIGMAIDYGNSISAVLNDDPSHMGGFLYTPAKEFYGGQFVLLPEDLKETRLFMDLVLIHPDVLLEKKQISVLNGSMISGKASLVGNRLRRLGFHTMELGNYNSDNPLFKSFIKNFSSQKSKTLEILKEIFAVDTIQIVPPETISPDNLVDIQLVLGTN